MTYRILSLDGGGMRGIISAIWAEWLEHEVGRPLYQCFDLIAGTSTGGLLGGSLAMGEPASAIVQLYREHGLTIFPKLTAPHIQHVVCGPKYNGRGLRQVAARVFQDKLFRECKTRMVATAFDTWTGRPIFPDSADPDYADWSLADVLLATTAAPTYLPAHRRPVEGEEDQSLIDGGVAANNPTAVAVAVADSALGNGDSMLIVSIGTGETTCRISADEAERRGGWGWVPDLLPTVFDAGSDTVDWCLRRRFSPDNYFRVQCPLPKDLIAMDDASPENLRQLTALARDHMASGAGRRQLSELVAKLEGE